MRLSDGARKVTTAPATGLASPSVRMPFHEAPPVAALAWRTNTTQSRQGPRTRVRERLNIALDYNGEPTRTKASAFPRGCEIAHVKFLDHACAFLLKFFRLVVRGERLDQRLNFPVHHLLELVDGEADAVVGKPVLREIVGADFLAAVAGADHCFALLGQRGLLFFHLEFVETAAQHEHAFFAILDLRFFVLATDDRIRRNVRDAHRGIRSIHRLAAGTRRAEGVDAQVFGFDLDVDVFGFGQHRNRNGGSVNSSLLLGGGYALHAVGAAFILELGEYAVAFDDGDDFLQAAG